MKIRDRDRRALILLAAVSVVLIGWWLGSGDDPSTQVVGAVDNIPAAERRLARLRQVAAAVPGREQVFQKAAAELAVREKNLVQADTAAQAQAQLLQILVRIGKKQTPPIDMRNTEIGQVKALGSSYGEVFVAVNFESGIEQLVQFLADVTAQKELISTTDMRIGTAHPKAKTIPVRITVSGVVRRDLIPDKKGLGTL